MITKKEFLDELTDNTFVKLRPSPLGGVGVFAIKRIPKNCKTIFSSPDANDEWITLTKEEVEGLPAHAKDMIYNYCLHDHDKYFVPASGFKKMDLSNYLNHSEEPNIASISDGDFFESIRDIEEGEELLINYGTIVDYDENDE